MRPTTTNKILISLSIAWVLVLFIGDSASAQYTYLDGEALAVVADNQKGDVDSVAVAEYRYYVIKKDNRLASRTKLYRMIGHSKNKKGGRKELVQLLNRNNPPLQNLSKGDTLVLPLDFDLDFRAHSPFPRYYEGAKDLDKLMIIEKTQQVFGVYEYGKLSRWGVVSTGDPTAKKANGKDGRTPTGRYNFNWKQESRISSLSPPGQRWWMHWVFNFHKSRGIHVHQYPLPVGGAISHGCVRMSPADAKYIYQWADGWKRNGTRVVKQGSMIIVIGDETKPPKPFDTTGETPVVNMVTLPDSPWDVAPGTQQQEIFDRKKKD